MDEYVVIFFDKKGQKRAVGPFCSLSHDQALKDFWRCDNSHDVDPRRDVNAYLKSAVYFDQE